MKKGRRQGFKNADTKSRSPPVIPRQKKKSSFVMSVFGTGAMGNIRIRMIKTKLVSVVASKFTPYLDALTFSEFLKEKKIACQKIETVQSRYSSFKVSAECNEVSEISQFSNRLSTTRISMGGTNTCLFYPRAHTLPSNWCRI